MNNPDITEISFSEVTPVSVHQVRWQAEKLRSDQAARIFRSLARLISAGYGRLSSHGAEMNIPARSSRGLF